MKTHNMRSRFGYPGAAAAQITVPDQDDSQVKEIDYVRWLSQLQADLAQSMGGVTLQACRPVPIGKAPAGTMQPVSSPGRLLGWSMHETSGTQGAVVKLWDGRQSGDKLLAVINISTGGVTNGTFPTSGVSVTDAIFVELLASGSQSVEGVLYIGAAD